MTTTISAPNAAASGTFTLGGDLTVNRLGFGAMRITGKGIWGEPQTAPNPSASCAAPIELGVNFIDTADSYGPYVSEDLIAEALYPYPERSGDRHQRRLDPSGAGPVAARRSS